MLGNAQSAPENKGALDVLALRKRRLDAARLREVVAIGNLSNYCIAVSSALHAQVTSAAAAIAPRNGAVATSVPSTSIGNPDIKIMKRKLPEPRDGWKDSAGKTHRITMR